MSHLVLVWELRGWGAGHCERQANCKDQYIVTVIAKPCTCECGDAKYSRRIEGTFSHHLTNVVWEGFTKVVSVWGQDPDGSRNFSGEQVGTFSGNSQVQRDVVGAHSMFTEIQSIHYDMEI